MAEKDTLLSQIAFSHYRLVLGCTYCLRLYIYISTPSSLPTPLWNTGLPQSFVHGYLASTCTVLLKAYCGASLPSGRGWNDLWSHGLALCGWGTETNLLAFLPEKAAWMQVGSGNSWELHVGQELTSCTDSHTLVYFPRFLTLPSNVLWVVFPCHWNYFNQLNLSFLGCREKAPGPDWNHCAE